MNISNSEELFVVSLFTNFGLSFAVPHIPTKYRWLYTTAIGLLNVLMFSGYDGVHFFVCIISSYLASLLLCKTRFAGFAVFCITFGYIAVVRYCHLANIYHLPEAADMCFLLMVFKAVWFGFTAEDKKACPSVLDFIKYIFYFPGLWSGPFLSYDLVMDALNSEETKQIQTFSFILSRIVQVAPHIIMYYFVTPYVPRDTMLTEEFAKRSIFYRVAFTIIHMIARRGRYLTAWFISESTCVATGVAFDKSKPFFVDFPKFKAFSPFDVELSASFKDVIRAWNCTVQTWLVMCVYKRVPFKSRLWRQVTTMSVSAFWHGLEPGYYLTFTLAPFFQFTQDLAQSVKWPGADIEVVSWFYHVLNVLCTASLLDFIAVPFAFLDFKTAIQAWSNLSFYGVWIGVFYVCMYFIGRAVNPPKKREHKKEGEEKKTE